eukprot:GHVN01050794.1.p1 GENE.GHVN01050794.1~~GHVN01050794.1.p1  ORF type:complete len:485 (+),score=41.57 GHVN01050794.1:129-1583(+)
MADRDLTDSDPSLRLPGDPLGVAFRCDIQADSNTSRSLESAPSGLTANGEVSPPTSILVEQGDVSTQGLQEKKAFDQQIAATAVSSDTPALSSIATGFNSDQVSSSFSAPITHSDVKTEIPDGSSQKSLGFGTQSTSLQLPVAATSNTPAPTYRGGRIKPLNMHPLKIGFYELLIRQLADDGFTLESEMLCSTSRLAGNDVVPSDSLFRLYERIAFHPAMGDPNYGSPEFLTTVYAAEHLSALASAGRTAVKAALSRMGASSGGRGGKSKSGDQHPDSCAIDTTATVIEEPCAGDLSVVSSESSPMSSPSHSRSQSVSRSKASPGGLTSGPIVSESLDAKWRRTFNAGLVAVVTGSIEKLWVPLNPGTVIPLKSSDATLGMGALAITHSGRAVGGNNVEAAQYKRPPGAMLRWETTHKVVSTATLPRCVVGPQSRISALPFRHAPLLQFLPTGGLSQQAARREITKSGFLFHGTVQTGANQLLA